MKKLWNQIGRIAPDIIVSAVLLWAFFSGIYEALPAPLQLIALKMILVSMAFLHAHIVGKIAFPSVDWDDPEDSAMKKALRISLYLVFIYAYSTGG